MTSPLPILILLLWLVAASGCSEKSTEVTQPDWVRSPEQLIFDHHMHTRFSDGRLHYAELIDLAAEGGCDALTVSDHSDSPAAYSADYLAAVQAARSTHPQLLIFAGLELEMPSYSGREHLGLVLHPRTETELLTRVGAAVELVAGNKEARDTTADALVLAPLGANSRDALVVYNHPSRKDRSAGENLEDFRLWSSHSGRNLLISGAPGHQAAEQPGDYREPLLTVDRWDPAVAEVGGTWDQLLDSGEQVWGAIAASDYHNDKKDFAPCTFARTHILAASRSYGAVLDALAAGTFWAGHGDVLSELQLSVEADPAAPLAYPGAIVRLASPDPVLLVRLVAQRSAGGAGLPLTAELISNCEYGAPAVFSELPLDARTSDVEIFLPVAGPGGDGESCYVRARVAATIDGERLLAYTNAIRLRLP